MAVDGNNILYYYFKDELMNKGTEKNRTLLQHLIRSLSIWLPIELYSGLPVLLPFVVRDATCRKSNNKMREEWGSCDQNGNFRDDNTLVKAIPRKFTISSSIKAYNRQKMGKGFVASHIWRKLDLSSELASANPLTNTFVPNLVWLPSQVSKLTDIEDSFAQKYLQALSFSIYRNVELTEDKTEFVEQIWNNFSKPEQCMKIEQDRSKLNFFDIKKEDIKNRVDKLLLLKNLPDIPILSNGSVKLVILT